MLSQLFKEILIKTLKLRRVNSYLTEYTKSGSDSSGRKTVLETWRNNILRTIFFFLARISYRNGILKSKMMIQWMCKKLAPCKKSSKFDHITDHQNFFICLCDQTNHRYIARFWHDFEHVGICASRSYLVSKHSRISFIRN